MQLRAGDAKQVEILLRGGVQAVRKVRRAWIPTAMQGYLAPAKTLGFDENDPHEKRRLMLGFGPVMVIGMFSFELLLNFRKQIT